MTLPELKRRLQDHLTDGLAVIVGSGLSAGLGIATMSQLSTHLRSHPPNLVDHDEKKQWTEFVERLEGGVDLESALNAIEMSSIEEHIVRETSELILTQEAPIVRSVLEGTLRLPLRGLLTHLFATVPCVPIITTNYDRMIELAADTAEIGVDSMFCGQVLSRFDHQMSRESLGFAAHTRTRKDIQRKYRKHVRLFKVHGSVDWYNYNGLPVRCAVPVGSPRLMITPGKTKYARGYEQPFDTHRNKANEAIDWAGRFLVLGFGFNDQQLETHLRPRIRNGCPCVVLTKDLSSNALAVVKSSPSVLALSESRDPKQPGTLLTVQKEQVLYPNVAMWDLSEFLREVLT